MSNKQQYNIHEMTFLQDVKNCLQDIGELPEVSFKHTVELMKENEKLKEATLGIEKLKQANLEIEQLKEEILKLKAQVNIDQK